MTETIKKTGISRRNLLKTGAAAVAGTALGTGAITGFPTIWAQNPITLRQFGTGVSNLNAIAEKGPLVILNAAAEGLKAALPGPVRDGGRRARARVVRQYWCSAALTRSAVIALPTVLLAFFYGQSRIFFVMARDGLLPERLSSVHPKYRTPHVVTIFTGWKLKMVMSAKSPQPTGRPA